MNYNGNHSPAENVIIASVVLPRSQRWEVEENLSELRQLASTSGVEVVDQLIQDRQTINPAYFIGRGKVEELTQMVKMHDVSTVIFDDDLTPAQVRNLENAVKVKIIDRSALILDIFAQHARTRTAKTQVELAQLQYFLPRLTRQWSHLSRQVGGIGTKGPGETQLETDRRLIRQRIETLRKELKKIDQQRHTRRKGRQNLFRVSLIGYTNVGKSTIMNLLSGADVLVENQLFATLDPTVRQVHLDKDHTLLLSDTVGFIRKLPHHLVESFKTTLDEAMEADLLLHVVDVSHPAFQDQIGIVNEVLQDINALEKPVLTVFNKIDLLKEKAQLQTLKREYPDSVFMSAARQIRTQELKQRLIEFMETHFTRGIAKIPLRHSRLLGRIYDLAIVSEEKYTDTEVTLHYRCIPQHHAIIQRLVEDAHTQNGRPG